MTDREIFLALLDLPDAAARAQYLDGACGDPERRARIESLLLSHEAADSFLDNPAVKPPAPDALATQELAGEATPHDDANGAEDLQFLSPSTRPDSLGRLGHYEMLQVLGRGGFGIVFRAFDEVLQRVVAVKVMAPQIATLSPARKRFVREARSSAAVRHENVVQIYEVGERPLPYLAMEFIPGETLQQKLDRSGPLDVSEVLRIGRQIAEGLAAAHACDLIHRDIKPANVLIEGGPQQRAKITDFGLARAADDASISQSGIIAGTPMYMAPEQALGHKLDQRADLFSLGSVLYQMVAGRPPFRAPSTLAVLKRVAEESPRPIAEIIPEAPAWLCEIIAKLHAKNPDERFQSAREVADVLADCEAQLKAHGKVKDFSRIPRGKPRRSGRWKWVAAAAVLLLPVMALVGTELAGVTHLFRGQPTPDPIKPGGDPTPVQVAGQEPPRSDQKPAKKDADLFDRLTFQQIKGLLPGKGAKNIDASPGPTNKVPAGTVLVYRTIKGRYGKCKVVNYDVNLELKWLTYDGTGKVYTQGDQLVIHPTYCCNLDAGKECGRGQEWESDIFYEQVNEQKRVIHPINGAVLQVTVDGGVMEAMPAVTQPASKPPPPTFTSGIGMEFVIVPKGKSWLGGGKDKLGDQEVEIPAGFYLGKYEVTQEEWEKVMGENPSHFSRTGGGMDAVKDISDADLKRFPVESVSWDQCQIFVEKLNRLEKETGWVYRLPTEVEWEYACRGGPMADKLDSAFDFYFARPTNILTPEQANFGLDKGLNRTCKVGGYATNRLGLCDMHGNVFEWCSDSYVDRRFPDLHRVHIGGSWHAESATWCRAGGIVAGVPSQASNYLGVRLVRVPSGAPSPEAKTPPPAVAPFTDADVKRIAALPAAEQIEEVRKELKRLNPGFDGKLEHKIEDADVTVLRINTDKVTDIAPIRVFNGLRVLECTGTYTNKPNGLLADLTPLEGMNLAGLIYLDLANTQVADAGLIRFKDCKALTHLNLPGTRVSDAGLIPFKDCKALTYLNLEGTQVSDAGLAHFKGMALTGLWIDNTRVTDLNALQGMPLEDIRLTPKNITRGLDILRDMKSLKSIGIKWNPAWPAAEFWERYDKGEFKE